MSASGIFPGDQLVPRVILVEDDDVLREVVAVGLGRFGFDVRGVADGRALDEALERTPADIVVLDLNLPGEDGVAIAARLKKASRCGIVVVSARGRLEERLLGLEVGVDLYFVKPVDIRELAAALRNLAWRLLGDRSCAWRLDVARSLLRTPGGIETPLTAQELIVMRELAARPGENISRQTIFAALDQPDDSHADQRLETLLSRLRAKVRQADPDASLPVRARYAMGYAFLDDIAILGDRLL